MTYKSQCMVNAKLIQKTKKHSSLRKDKRVKSNKNINRTYNVAGTKGTGIELCEKRERKRVRKKQNKKEKKNKITNHNRI